MSDLNGGAPGLAAGSPHPLLIAGTGGFGRECLEAVRAVNAQNLTWDPVAWLDDDPRLLGSSIQGLPVVGPISEAANRPDAQVVVTVGNPENFTHRQRIVADLALPAERFATVIHPSASLSSDTVVGAGSVILASAVATSNVLIGRHVAIMPGVVLTHDDVIGDFATLASGVRLAGAVTVGRGAYLGAGAMVREKLRIGDWSLVGMGAGITCDVPPGQVWAGLPARYLRDVAALPAT